MAKVELDNVGEDLSGIGYIGFIRPKIEDGSTILQAPGHLPRYFMYASTDQIQAAWQHASDIGYTPRLIRRMALLEHRLRNTEHLYADD